MLTKLMNPKKRRKKMAKRGAPRGNKNAKGRRGGKNPASKGYALGALGGVLPGGNFVAGAYSGVTKNATGMKKQRKAATTVGALHGAAVGGLGFGIAGAALGGVAGAASGYGLTKGGQATGKWAVNKGKKQKRRRK